jgi:hypothetical protein
MFFITHTPHNGFLKQQPSLASAILKVAASLIKTTSDKNYSKKNKKKFGIKPTVIASYLKTTIKHDTPPKMEENPLCWDYYAETGSFD